MCCKCFQHYHTTLRIAIFWAFIYYRLNGIPNRSKIFIVSRNCSLVQTTLWKQQKRMGLFTSTWLLSSYTWSQLSWPMYIQTNTPAGLGRVHWAHYLWTWMSCLQSHVDTLLTPHTLVAPTTTVGCWLFRHAYGHSCHTVAVLVSM